MSVQANVRVQTDRGVVTLLVKILPGESVRQAAWRTARAAGYYLLSDSVVMV